MQAPGTGQISTRLHDGRFLILGGEDVTDGFPVATVQIFNPASGTWTYGPDMSIGRIGATATTLRDGDVLVAGGLGPKLQPLTSAELFHPDSMRWSATSPLPQNRFAQSATLLLDGTVLLVGGIVDGEISSSSLVFDPSAQRWTAGAQTLHAHAQQTAVRLSGGGVLVVGGYGPPETYDGGSRRWHTDVSTAFRSHPIVTVLHNGTVLVAAGVSSREHDLRSANIYEPVRGRWSRVGSLRTARNQAASAVLRDGTVLVTGGEQVTVHVLRSTEVFDSQAGTWHVAASMHVPRDTATVLPLHDGSVMICGGMNLTGVLSSCETYHP